MGDVGPQRVLAGRFRSRLKHALQQAETLPASCAGRLETQLGANVQPVGSGEPALKYLAAYVHQKEKTRRVPVIGPPRERQVFTWTRSTSDSFGAPFARDLPLPASHLPALTPAKAILFR